MAFSKVIILALASVSQSARFKRGTEIVEDSCSGLHNIVVNGTDFTSAAKFVCQKWPFGSFPIKKANDFADALKDGVSGGIWGLLEKAKAENVQNFCYRDIQLRPKDSSCDMKFLGTCYGKCPMGYQKSVLVGGFAPVCVSACTESSNGVGCILGCAKSKISCALTVMDQVKDAANVASNVKNLVLNNPLLNGFLNQLRSIADFALDTLKKIRDEALKIWAQKDTKSRIALLLTSVYTFVEDFKTLQGDVSKLKDMVTSTVDMFSDFFNGDFSVHGIVAALVKYGEYVFKQAVQVSDVFTTDRCKAIDKKVAFTIEEAGDDEVIGAYIPNGKRDGRPKYVMKGNPRVGVEYSGRQHKWRFYKGSLTGIFSKNLYLADVTAEDYPSTGWKAQDAPDPAPEVITVQQP